MNKGKVLTEDLVFSKAKTDNIQNVRSLNLWGNQLQDLSLLAHMSNLQILSISVNKITSLKDFSQCPSLQQLYLRKNNISDIKQIRYLFPLKNLTILWLSDNPIANHPNYRLVVIKHLPQLVKLDNQTITEEERQNAKAVAQSVHGQQSAPQVREDNMKKSNNSLGACLLLIKDLSSKELDLLRLQIDRLRIYS